MFTGVYEGAAALGVGAAFLVSVLAGAGAAVGATPLVFK